MPNRLLKESIKHSDEIDSLSWFQEVLFYRLLVTVDDYGRYYANPQIIKSDLFPTKEDLTKKSVLDALDRLEETGLIKRYEFDGKTYLKVTKWFDHQQCRANKSKFPDSNGNHLISNDIKKYQKKSDDGNGNQMSPYSYSNTDSKTKTNTGALADDDDMISIQHDHDILFDVARSIGLPMSDKNMSEIVRLYSEYGLEAAKHGLNEASRLNKVSIAYAESVARNYGKGKPKEDDDRLDDSFLETCIF